MSEETVEVVNTYRHSFERIAPGKTGRVPAWYLESYPGLKATATKAPKTPPKADEPELGLAELKAKIRESTDEEWLSDQLEDKRKSVSDLARERLESLSE